MLRLFRWSRHCRYSLCSQVCADNLQTTRGCAHTPCPTTSLRRNTCTTTGQQHTHSRCQGVTHSYIAQSSMITITHSYSHTFLQSSIVTDMYFCSHTFSSSPVLAFLFTTPSIVFEGNTTLFARMNSSKLGLTSKKACPEVVGEPVWKGGAGEASGDISLAVKNISQMWVCMLQLDALLAFGSGSSPALMGCRDHCKRLVTCIMVTVSFMTDALKGGYVKLPASLFQLISEAKVDRIDVPLSHVTSCVELDPGSSDVLGLRTQLICCSSESPTDLCCRAPCADPHSSSPPLPFSSLSTTSSLCLPSCRTPSSCPTILTPHYAVAQTHVFNFLAQVPPSHCSPHHKVFEKLC